MGELDEHSFGSTLTARSYIETRLAFGAAFHETNTDRWRQGFLCSKIGHIHYTGSSFYRRGWRAWHWCKCNLKVIQWSFFFNKRHIPVSKPPTLQFSHPGACVVLFVVRRWCEIEMACLVVLSPLFCDLLVPFPLLHRRSSWRSAWVGATWQFLGDFCRQRWRTCRIGWQNPCLGT